MNEKNQRKGKASRNKGCRGERELANLLRDQYGYETRRGYVFQHESDLVGLPGIHVECKRKERLSVYEAMEQAIEEADKRQDGLPTVFHRRDRHEWLVIMRLTDWIDLYGAWADEEGIHKATQTDS